MHAVQYYITAFQSYKRRQNKNTVREFSEKKGKLGTVSIEQVQIEQPRGDFFGE